MTVYPRWYALVCAAEALVALFMICVAFKRPNVPLLKRIFVVLGGAAAVASGAAFAYHIALGHPFKKDADANPAIRRQAP